MDVRSEGMPIPMHTEKGRPKAAFDNDSSDSLGSPLLADEPMFTNTVTMLEFESHCTCRQTDQSRIRAGFRQPRP